MQVAVGAAETLPARQVIAVVVVTPFKVVRSWNATVPAMVPAAPPTTLTLAVMVTVVPWTVFPPDARFVPVEVTMVTSGREIVADTA
jgi:hypothetical protein